MANGVKLIPIDGINTDLSNSYMRATQARFIKNLYYQLTDNAESATIAGSELGVLKPLPSTEVYCPILLPRGTNTVIGTLSSKETAELYVWVHNSGGNNVIFRINGDHKSCTIVYQKFGCLPMQLDPKYFIHEGGATLDIVYLVDPDTGETLIKKDLTWTDGYNYQGYLRTDDSIDTNFFDPLSFPYFAGNYDPCVLSRMGLPTPNDCVTFTEVERTDADAGANNNILYNTWQFRIKDTDVWGRVSDYGIISDEYVPGINDCISTSDKIARCLDLTFDAGNPTINTKEIAWRNCNDEVWHTEVVLFLWTGSNIGKWWLRQRNPEINYNQETNKITYRFCRDKECQAIDPAETNRLQPPQPQTSKAIFKLNKSLALANNTDGFNPFSQLLRSKFSFQITPPTQTDISTRNITIYIPIWNEALQNFQQVFKDDANGYAWGDNNSKHGGARPYLQYFTNIEQSGFVGYLVGGGLAISTQVYVDANGQLIDDPRHTGLDTSPIRLTFQKFVFNNVPRGTYVFRLAGSLSNPQTEANYQDSSTTVFGKCPFIGNGYQIDIAGRQNNQELLIDVCTADYDTMTQNEILVIADLAAFVNGQSTKAISGYAYETDKNGFNELPVELCNVTCQNGQVISNITDHNGFYYYATRGSGRNFNIRFRDKCITQQITNGQSGTTGMQLTNFILENYYANYSATDCNRILITGRLLLNGTNIGVSNSVVVLTRGRTALTDDTGLFTIIAHDDVLNGVRQDSIVIGAGGCAYTGINGTCIQIINITIQPCSTCTTRTLNVGTTDLEYKIERGLLSGGSYLARVNGYDWLGRKTYSQPIQQINIPTIVDSQAMGASVITGIIDPSATFPDEIQYLTYSLTAETTIEKYRDWIVDRVEFIDSTGAINIAAPTQIRIYYQSIIEYSAVHNYNTTTAWQIIPEGQNTPVISDKVQFFLNGDGKYFQKLTTSLIKYDTSGQSFLIDYTSDLKDLKANALMRLIRPKACTGTELDYEICKVIKIVNNKAAENSFVLNFFDTYYLPRQIPVPAPIAPAPVTTQITTSQTVGGITTGTTQTPVPVSAVLELRIFGFRFEHDSPSNFWGQGCKNIGRPNEKNPYESKLIHPNQIAFGGSLSINGQLNYTQYFDVANKHEFDIANTGGIVYVRPKQGILLIITQFNNFTVGFGDNLARIDANGNVLAPSGANEFGNPNIQVSGNYGCQFFDKNTIREKDGLVHFLDSSRIAILQHNYKDCEEISSNKTNPNRKSTILSWLTKKINFVKNFNDSNENKIFFHSVINPANNEYIITDFQINGQDYVNDERDYNAGERESFAFDIKADLWKGMYSPTPQYWGFLESDRTGNQLFAFRNGVAYSFYRTGIPTTYNTFFGVKCSRVYRFVLSPEIMKKIKPLWLEIYCKQSGYFADQILTETGQKSRILISYFKQGEFMFSAPFLKDILTLPDTNNPGLEPLLDGTTLYGTWADVRLIGYPDKDDVYSALEGCQVFFIVEQNTGIR